MCIPHQPNSLFAENDIPFSKAVRYHLLPRLIVYDLLQQGHENSLADKSETIDT